MFTRPPILTWQYWISFLRLVAGIYGIVYCAWMVEHYPNPSDPFDKYMLLSLLLWIWVVITDVFVMTMDFNRTRTYLGCIAAQVSINFTFIVLIVVCIGLELTRFGLYTYIGSRGHPKAVTLGISLPLAGLCSLCLLAINLWPVFMLHSKLSVKHILQTNTKDAFFVEHTPTTCTLSTFGRPRHIATPLPSPRELYTASCVAFHSLWVRIPGPRRWPGLVYGVSCHFGRLTIGFCTRLFFRRVSPVESRMYAVFRNTFAVASIGILAFRAATALQQAQNHVGTRIASADCDGRVSPIHTIGILMEHRYSKNININVATFSGSPWDQPLLDLTDFLDTGNCVRTFLVPPRHDLSNQSLELWTCHNQPQIMSQSDSYNSKPGALVDGIHITVTNLIRGSALGPNQVPLIWLLNLEEYSVGRNLTSVNDVRAYLPPWRPRRGLHVEAEAKLITRRFIKSSIMRDIILNAEPAYRPLSLYPIVESSTDMLNGTTSQPIRFARATATIRTSLNPGLMYFRVQADQQPLDPIARAEACDFIEDYRSGTVLDIVGSVGGLFALLHAAHVLLFGRPLLWGLTGAKLITPFGLLGACSSRKFKRRLKDHYHKQSPENGSETMRIGAFLRDFVIEFGPADIDIEHQMVQQLTASSSTLAINDKNADEIQIL
ncbi:unnamed protein product [Rhizoctonia solani]|uniref:Transmembrane protein n=1 Tax=Rhizoctonia solani TaxID=456999 RepID=A0A8H3BTT2_9AGAM|nr:unnamed protein product [Rhizoctonia solani]